MNQADATDLDNIRHPSDAITALCQLQAEVSEHHLFRHAADCFCGERQDWVDRGMWRNKGESLRFIIEATREKLARERGEPRD